MNKSLIEMISKYTLMKGEMSDLKLKIIKEAQRLNVLKDLMIQMEW